MNKNQRIRGSWLKVTSSALLPLMAATLPFSAPGWALTDRTTNANSVNVSQLKQSDVNCSDFCSNLVAYDGEQGNWSVKGERDAVTLGATGSKGWSSMDDQWCADHGYITDASVQPQTVSISATKCNVTMLTTDFSCSETNKQIMRCQFHNSQIIPQCLAYRAAGKASGYEKVVRALDVAAAATCGTQCGMALVTGGAGDASALACQAAGSAASASEAIQTLVMLSEGRFLQSIMGGAGTAVGATATYGNIAQGQFFKEQTGHESDLGDSSQKKSSCIAAATFAALAGLRSYNISKADGAKGDACKSVQSLASSAFGAPTTGTGGTNNGPGTGFSGVSTAGGTVTSVGSGGGNGASQLAGGTQEGGVPGCDINGCEVPGTLSAATDGGILKESGLDKLVAKPAAEIAAAFEKGVTPAQALQSALGGKLGAEASGALAGLAQATQDNASALGGKLRMGGGGGAMYASGGGGGSGRSGGEANPFGNLFGGAGAAGSGSRATASEEFGKGRVMDIYHTGTTQNLFEIVSSKVSQVAGRVGAR